MNLVSMLLSQRAFVASVCVCVVLVSFSFFLFNRFLCSFSFAFSVSLSASQVSQSFSHSRLSQPVVVRRTRARSLTHSALSSAAYFLQIFVCHQRQHHIITYIRNSKRALGKQHCNQIHNSNANI